MSHTQFERMELLQMLGRVRKYASDEGAELVEKAYRFAQKVHAPQKRKSGEPYFIHPQTVASILTQMVVDPPMIAAGLLHDTVEDCESVSLEDIRQDFGDDVALLVDGVTKLDKLDFGSKDEAKKESLRKMVLAMSKDIRVVMIKLADRLHNMQTMQHQKPERQVAIARETLDIYAPIAHRLGLSKIKQELEDLSLRYIDHDGYQRIAQLLDETRAERLGRINEISDILNDELSDKNISCTIDGRPKSIYSIYQKMNVRGKSFEEIYDLYAVRVLVDTVAECYQVLGVVHGLWHDIPGRFKDYINRPKKNMYQSLHTTVLVSLNDERAIPVEVQIRTNEMHRVAEYGIAAHWAYKEGSKARSEAEKFAWLRQMAELSEVTGDTDEFLEAMKQDLYAESVFVYTPKGDVKELPKGAIVIDFAYQIHSGVGDRCDGCRINGKHASLDTVLETGDRVEIITSSTRKGPKREWLSMVKTSGAKSKIKHFLKNQNRAENIELGRDMVEKECRRRGQTASTLIKREYCDGIMRRNGFTAMDDIFNEVGFGGMSAEYVVGRLLEEYRAANPAPPKVEDLLAATPASRPERRIDNGIYMPGNEDMDIPVRFGKCCSPVPGDRIVGFITRGRGVTVHKAECVNARHGEKERLVAVEWAENTNAAFATPITVTAYDETGLLVRLASVFSDRKIPLKSVSTSLDEKMHTATFRFVVEVRSRDQANELVRYFLRQPGVIETIGAGQGN